MKEHELQNAVAHEMRSQGWVTVRVNSSKQKINGRWQSAYHIFGLKTPNSGLNDLIGFRDNKCLLIEVKRDEKQKLRKTQEDCKVHFERHGNTYHVVSSISDIQLILEEQNVI